MKKIVALHKHWCAADAIRITVAETSGAIPEEIPPEYVAMAKLHSRFLKLSVFYSLLYVVVEGYRDLELTDNSVDSLLSEGDHVGYLRRFRNATFHYQGDPLSRKLLDFLETENSESWAINLHLAFRALFERELGVTEIIQSLGQGPTNASS